MKSLKFRLVFIHVGLYVYVKTVKFLQHIG